LLDTASSSPPLYPSPGVYSILPVSPHYHYYSSALPPTGDRQVQPPQTPPQANFLNSSAVSYPSRHFADQVELLAGFCDPLAVQFPTSSEHTKKKELSRSDKLSRSLLVHCTMVVLLSTSVSPAISTKVAQVSFIPSTKYCFFSGLNEINGKNKIGSGIFCFSARGQTKSLVSAKSQGKKGKNNGISLIFSEGKDVDDTLGLICPGCGIYMQDKDPNHPGYYKKRKVEEETDLLDEEGGAEIEGLILDELDEDVEDFVNDLEASDRNEEGSEEEDEIGWESDDWDDEFDGDEDDDGSILKEQDGFAPAGAGFGKITEELLEDLERKSKKLSKSERKRLARETQREREEVTVCARCHSLRNYGQVKNQAAENLIPDFDFERLISIRLMRPTGNADGTVVVMVVDCVDFDGSFPKRAARSLFKALEECENDSKLRKRMPKLVLVATKVDLLPSQISPTRLDRWVRHRARALGAPKVNAVYLVSSRKDIGVRNLLSYIKEQAGPRGHVWVIGAQNAGKSTLINMFSKKEGAKVTKLTEAAVPGTTLGILKVGGILPAKAKMYDTPGLLHSYLMSMRLNREEQKMVEIRKELQPRSYRIKASQSIHIGGLVRLDLTQASVQTIYVTVWASPHVALHLGKIENADEIWGKHAGIRLQPPVSQERASELGKWRKPRELKVVGSSWDVNSLDVAIAGLGWFSLGLKGQSTLNLWTYDGVDVTQRDPLVLDRAPFLERPGFWLPQAISDALGSQSKQEGKRKKRLEEEQEDSEAYLQAI
ncbi:hypothetical protein V2J09_016329, partial [Rumex salicifolius]